MFSTAVSIFRFHLVSPTFVSYISLYESWFINLWGGGSMGGTDCVVVLTARGITQILREGGSQAWRLDPSHAGKYEYAVCVQNTKPSWGTPEAKHHHAFLVGRISGISRSPDHPETRWILNFDSYAEIDVPNQWGGNRNPVSYGSLEKMGIDISKLDFKPLQKVEFPESDEGVGLGFDDVGIRPLSLQEAKRGLAMKFGVSEEDIQITING